MNKVYDHDNPDSPNTRPWNRTWAWVAVQISLKDFGKSYFGLLWSLVDGATTPTPDVVACFRPDSKICGAAVEHFCGEGGATDEGYRELSIHSRLADVGSFEQKLDELIKKWGVLWKKAGGLDGLLGRPAEG
jgi:hypothetical protein